MKDVLRLCGLSFYGYHGISAAEKETGRVFEVDCEMELDLAGAGHSDRLGDTVDYTAVYSIIRETVEGKAFALLETLASSLASKVLNGFPVYRVTLKVRKLLPPLAGHVKHIEVEVTRHQGDTAKLTGEADIQKRGES
ncbi:MAG: dihydroneopterin aldolase [Candidatus Zixiibacteriota bacterium]|nr:MAG: dihydroneopterin aldolase [candidate division Zixibacteria bacterium]